MTKLNLLGAQRVKALTEILERKYNDAISEVRNNTKTNEETAIEMANDKGVRETLEKVIEAKTFLENAASILREGIATDVKVNIDYGYYRASNEVYVEFYKIKEGDNKAIIREIKRELEDKKSQLWLVETLEQAQDIVQSPIKALEGRDL